MCERQRACVVTGIADYFVHPNTKYILATSGDKVIRYRFLLSFETSLFSKYVLEVFRQFCVYYYQSI